MYLVSIVGTDQSFNPSHTVGVAIGSWDGFSKCVAISHS